MRKVAKILEERVYEIAAALVLEVGKNRLEALGEAQECRGLLRGLRGGLRVAHAATSSSCRTTRSNVFVSRNRSVMRPYGVWAVIAPFNFPIALAAGPAAAALVTGNTVVLKCASDTPWAGRLLADCIRDAGLPPGVFNYVNGAGRRHRRADDPRCAHGGGRPSPARSPSAARSCRRWRRPLRAALHRRDGRQEPGHRHGERGPRPRGGRHRPLGLWHGRAEVLGALAALRA